MTETLPAPARRARLKIAGAAAAALAIAAFGAWKFTDLGGRGVIPHEEALNHIGEDKTVEGVVDVVWRLESMTILDFDVSSLTNFMAVIRQTDYAAFPPRFEKLYQDRKIRVSGKIETFEGAPEIILKHPSQIKIVGEGPAEIVPGENPVSWKDAGKFASQIKTVEGVIEAVVRPDDKVTWLEFKAESKTDLQGKIFAVTYDHFPEGFDQLYKGKKVRIAGKIGVYKGQPEIIIRKPAQIRIVGE